MQSTGGASKDKGALPPIYSFANYREFIKEYFSYQKQVNRHFSHAFFAKKAGFKSRTFMLKVMKGEKGLARSSIYQVASAMDLGKKEREYFNALVFFNEAKTLEEKNFYYSKLQSTHKTHKAVLLRNDQYQYFYNWYNASIREIITFSDFKGDVKKLGNMLDPPISGKKARDAVELLVRLNLIRQDGERYVQTDEIITTGDEVRSLAVQNFQKDNLDLAKKALEKFRQEKEISTLTFAIDKEGYKELKQEIISFRKRMIDLIVSRQDLDRIYQLNFQLFPLSQLPDEKDR
jgi:uncharacterized protein (TIGR02147 family)